MQRENTSKANQISILGKKFGNLTVIGMETPRKCTCKCDCGNIVHVSRSKLTNGTFMDCSDVVTLDVVGKRFGRLTVISQNGSRCMCQCDCGNVIEIKYGRLSSGHTKSCGCAKTIRNIRNNIKGQMFGKLVALSCVRRNGRTYWTCKCDCGNIRTITRTNLVSGNTKSCGCLHKEIISIIGNNNN